MRTLIDIAWPQLEYDDGSPKPVDYASLASTADAFLVRWTSYEYWLAHGRSNGDTQYNIAMRELQARGKPTGPYMYAGAGAGASPEASVDDWAAATEVTPTFFPMYDLEEVFITGNELTDWVNRVLQRMTQIWGLRPILYVGPFKPAQWGLAQPTVPHILQVAEYPTMEFYGYGEDLWGRALSYPQWADGPDTPWGDWDIWQAMSTLVNVPGLPADRTVDLSFVKDRVFELLAASGHAGATVTSPPSLTVAPAPRCSAYPHNPQVVATVTAEYAA